MRFLGVHPLHQLSLLAAMTLALALTGPATGADREAEARLRLTGPVEKEWTYVRVVEHLGRGEGCDQGETWTFRKDGTLMVRRCVNGSFLMMRDRWNVEATGTIDVELHVVEGDREDQYFVTFPPAADASAERLRLRVPAAAKTEHTRDLELSRRLP